MPSVGQLVASQEAVEQRLEAAQHARAADRGLVPHAQSRAAERNRTASAIEGRRSQAERQATVLTDASVW